jgi:tetratricopeptide (TPR) repeat protein
LSDHTQKNLLNWTASIASILSLFFAAYTFFFNSPAPPIAVSLNPQCGGLLISKPLSEMRKEIISKRQDIANLHKKILCYLDQIEVEPNNAIPYTNLGEAMRRLGKIETARSLYRKAVELNPTLAEAKQGLALLQQEKNSNLANWNLPYSKTIGIEAEQIAGALSMLKDGTIQRIENLIKKSA